MGARRKQAGAACKTPPRAVRYDPLRAFVFPNNLREERRRAGLGKLLQLSQKIPEIPYIRFSKIERGEVFARADELARIAAVMDLSPVDLLVDVDDPAFDLASWAAPFVDPDPVDPHEEQFAVLLGAALHMRRATDRSLSIAALNDRFGLPPVIVSRIENACKTLDRWNDHVVDGLLRIFAVRSTTALRRIVEEDFAGGRLAPFLDSVSNPELRREKTRARVAELRAQLLDVHAAASPPLPPAAPPEARVSVRLVAVFGMPLPDGLIALVPTGETVAAPVRGGLRAYGLRIGRPTLGGGMPGNATLVVDPDRFPSSGGLAVITEGAHRRVLTLGVDRHGA
ncbi:MAG: hypothetical protein JWO25_2913, partial [Alphaproteobacteria bacterium]|nr:hypothetical protein [Alphaproteobacteria bacterium]